jgi:hypothetical protein
MSSGRIADPGYARVALVERWWFADAVVIFACLSPLVLAALMTPSDTMLHLFGVEIPVMCQWRRIFGVSCPGCGLTRSFVYLAHLQPVKAFEMNLLGPPFFLAMGGIGLRAAIMLGRRAWTRRA